MNSTWNSQQFYVGKTLLLLLDGHWKKCNQLSENVIAHYGDFRFYNKKISNKYSSSYKNKRCKRKQKYHFVQESLTYIFLNSLRKSRIKKDPAHLSLSQKKEKNSHGSSKKILREEKNLSISLAYNSLLFAPQNLHWNDKRGFFRKKEGYLLVVMRASALIENIMEEQNAICLKSEKSLIAQSRNRMSV